MRVQQEALFPSRAPPMVYLVYLAHCRASLCTVRGISLRVTHSALSLLHVLIGLVYTRIPVLATCISLLRHENYICLPLMGSGVVFESMRLTDTAQLRCLTGLNHSMQFSNTAHGRLFSGREVPSCRCCVALAILMPRHGRIFHEYSAA